MSIEWLCVDFTKIFSKGQAYVALSRAKSLEGLCVSNLSQHKVATCLRCLNIEKQFK